MAGAEDQSLSNSYFPRSITTTAGTTKAAPLVTAVAIPPAVLVEVDLLIPRGHAGQTGIQVVYSGDVILPFRGATAEQWIIGDDDHQVFPVSFPLGGGLQVRTFNTGVFAHTHYVRFRVDYNAYSAQRRSLVIVPVA